MPLAADVRNAYGGTFFNAMEDPHQLVMIHRRLTQGRGRRTSELSLNRSIVVLAVASWQAYIEELARALLTSLGPPDDRSTAGRTLLVLWYELSQDLERQVRNYSTANADNTINLLSALGFNPRPHWTWGFGGGRIAPGDAMQRLNQWVRVRNSIAHGAALPGNTKVITENKAGPTVRLKDAEACIAFIEHMAQGTNGGIVEYAERGDVVDSRIRFDEMRRQSALASIARQL